MLLEPVPGEVLADSCYSSVIIEMTQSACHSPHCEDWGLQAEIISLLQSE